LAEQRFDYPKLVCDEWPANEISTEIANVFVLFEGDIVLTSDDDCFFPSTEILMLAEQLLPERGGRRTLLLPLPAADE